MFKLNLSLLTIILFLQDHTDAYMNDMCIYRNENRTRLALYISFICFSISIHHKSSVIVKTETD